MSGFWNLGGFTPYKRGRSKIMCCSRKPEFLNGKAGNVNLMVYSAVMLLETGGKWNIVEMVMMILEVAINWALAVTQPLLHTWTPELLKACNGFLSESFFGHTPRLV